MPGPLRRLDTIRIQVVPPSLGLWNGNWSPFLKLGREGLPPADRGKERIIALQGRVMVEVRPPSIVKVVLVGFPDQSPPLRGGGQSWGLLNDANLCLIGPPVSGLDEP